MLASLHKERPAECISDLAFDEWRAGELEGGARARLESHLASCERCRTRTDAQEQAAAAFLQRFPPPPQPAITAIGHEPRHERRRVPWVAAGASLLAVAAALVLVVRPAGNETTRTKGGAHVAFFVKRGERVFEGSSGERLQAGDRLRFTVTLQRAQHLAIFSRDARGVASVYYPAGSATRVLPAGRDIALDSSVELDATLGDERLYALFCDDAIAVEAIRAALERTGSVVAPAGCTIDEAVFTKEVAR